MSRWILTASAALMLLPSAVSAASPEDSRGVHPWESRAYRNPSIVQPAPETDYEALYYFYYDSPHKSKTHALHPFHRKRYYARDPYVVVGRYDRLGNSYLIDAYEYDNRLGYWVRSDARIAKERGRPCNDYAYSRPNYRVPPYDYECAESPAAKAERPMVRRSY